MPAARTNPLEKLREPFPVEQVKQRPGGGGKKLDYVPIETVLERLLTVAPEYHWIVMDVQLTEAGVIVRGNLTIDGKVASGVGAMKNPDLDMAVKSANSEAMKNAAKNGFGVALELWDEDHRAELETQRREVVQNDSKLFALKARVADIATLQGADLTAEAIAAHFGVSVEDLQDEATLERIVAQEVVSV